MREPNFVKTKHKMVLETRRRRERSKWVLPVAIIPLASLLLCCLLPQAPSVDCNTIKLVGSKSEEEFSRVRNNLKTTSDNREAGSRRRAVSVVEKDIATGQSNSNLRTSDIISNSPFNSKLAPSKEEAASSIQAAPSNANGNQFEIAEGLTIGQPSSSLSLSSPAAAGGLQGNEDNLAGHNKLQQHQWPLKQLERIKSESKVSALVGQNAILNCAVQFKDGIEKPFVVNWFKYPHKLPIYIWYAGYPPHIAQDYENRAYRLGQASLNLTKVRESDKGLYECKIYYLDRRPEDKGNGTWIYLDVQAPPRFTQTPAAVSYVQAGDSLQLTCRAESTPSPVLRWYKNKLPIDSDSGPFRLLATLNGQQQVPGSDSRRLGGAEAANANQLDLLIENVQAGHTTGEYACLASNSEGSIEARAQVSLAVPAVITTMPRNQTRLEGEKMELLCQAKGLPANITYKWLFNEKPLEGSKWFEARSVVRHDGTLVLHSVHRDDQGLYKCQASNGLSQRPSRSGQPGRAEPILAEASAQLTVEFPARISYSPPVQYLPLGLSGLIRCFYQASPSVEFFTWTLNGEQFDPNVDPNVERLANGSLLVKQVSKQYEGKYRCTPFNKHGSAGSSAAMEVRVEEPPQFDLKPADFYKATINGHVKIPCDAHGLPKPTVSWRRVVQASPGQQPARNHQSSEPGGSGAHLHGFEPTTAGRRPNRRPNSIRRRASGNGDGLLVVDEPAGEEQNEDHHLYQTIKSNSNDVQHEQLINGAGNNSMISELAGSSQAQAQLNGLANHHSLEEAGEEQARTLQSVIISYAKLPSDRSEHKQSHLFLHGLRKEDHGKYECVVENEVATLVAQTMLYIEETTPHAPTNLRLETKTWSAQLSWLPGYDGGFEQSFVVWYRQLVAPEQSDEEETEAAVGGGLPSSQAANRALASSGLLIGRQQELKDFNWKSANVQPGDATTFTIQNLSQDTSYEFYVRARNIIGDGPGSQTVIGRTKKAVLGAITPITGGDLSPTTSVSDSEESATSFPIPISSPSGMDEDESADASGGVTLHPTVMGIIHLVDISTAGAESNDTGSTSPSVESSSESSDSQDNSAGNKVIRIYFPSKSSTGEASNNTSLSSNSKRSDAQGTPASLNNSSSNSTQPPEDSSSSSTQEPVDFSTAPQNVSMMKVAQGWVINWWPPQRLALGPSELERIDQLTVAASQSGSGNSHLPALSQVQLQADSSVSLASSKLAVEQQQQPAAYSVEFREKGSGWQTLATSKERSLLLKDLKAGSEYSFRVFAHAPGGHRGSPTPEFKYLIPDNRRKPGSTQALSAGVVSGILFFIACIVIAVCAVNICNKRRRKRSEKAAYVMMACPVLETHQDIAALNSNSLMKNARGQPAAQGRVPSLDGLSGGLFGENLRSSGSSKRKPISGGLSQVIVLVKRRIVEFLSARKSGGPAAAAESGGQEGEEERASEESMEQVDIDYTDNAPMPIDVNNLERPPKQEPPRAALRTKNKSDEDYWIRVPLDRKWGTLTVAASKLAERRAFARQQKPPVDGELFDVEIVRQASPEVDSLEGELNHRAAPEEEHFGSRTLPRWFQVKQQNGAFLQTFRQQQPPPPRNELLTNTCWPLPQQFGLGHLEAPPPPQFGTKPTFAPNETNGSPLEVQFARQLVHSQHLRSFSQLEASQVRWQQALGHQQHLLQLHHQQHRYLASGLRLANQPEVNVADSSQTNESVLGKRNSFARSTLPLASGLGSTPIPWSGGQPAVVLPLAGEAAIGASQLVNYYQSHNKFGTGELQREKPTRPIFSNLYSANTFLQMSDQQNSGFSALDDDDDPITENACLGSYKRKRRLPHIEAQFTITKPPELPPKTYRNSRKQPGEPSKGALSEEQAIQRGELFVKSLSTATCKVGQQADSSARRLARALPQPGQRREQRSLKSQLPIAVETINTREKIESYLRNYEGLSQVSRAGGSARQAEAADSEAGRASISSGGSSAELAFDQPNELTFQPYYNLPTLKYTIRLPLKEVGNGRLLLEETNELRRKRRARRPSLNVDQSTLEEQHRVRPKKRLGSSSSCPAPPAELPNGSLGTNANSLESALDKPPTFCQPDSLLKAHITPDSLEAFNQQRSVPQVPMAIPPRNSPRRVPTSSLKLLEVSLLATPPPVPPHRGSKAKTAEAQQHEQLGRLNSLSSQQSSSSATSSSSSSTMDNGTSESHTTAGDEGDHFVDENYEFDLVSSCSSSNRRNRKQTSPKRHLVGEDIYSQVSHRDSASLAKPPLPPKLTTRFYTNSSLKEQPLVVRAPSARPKNNDSNDTITPTEDRSLPGSADQNHYDAVCDEENAK